MLRRILRPETTIFLGIWFVLMIFGRSKLFRDPGTFWHTVAGERMLSTGHFITTDPFSFTCAGKEWIAYEWLGECLMALVHRIAGLDSLLLATVSLLALFFTWIAHRLIRAGVHPLLTLLIVCIAAAGSSNHFHVRPHMATMVILGFTLGMLCDFESGRISLRRLLWLVPLFLIWANIHGGFIGGMATLLFVVTGWIVTWILWNNGPIILRRQAVLLLGITAACGLTAFINPYGAELPRTWFSIMDSSLLPKIIIEHAPLTSSPATLAAVLPAAVLYIATLTGVFPKRPRVTWLLPLVWLGLGWMRVRHASLFAVTFVVVLPDMLPHVRWIKWLSKHGSEFCNLQNPGPNPGPDKFKVGPAVIPLLLIITTLGFQIAGIRLPVLGSSWAKLDAARWPVGLIGELKSIESRVPDGTPIFNDFLYGGFIIYYAPRFRVFIDDRWELYGDRGLSRFTDAEKNPGKIDEFVEEYGLEFALVMADSNFDRYLSNSKHWSVIGRTDPAALYQRISIASKSDPH